MFVCICEMLSLWSQITYVLIGLSFYLASPFSFFGGLSSTSSAPFINHYHICHRHELCRLCHLHRHQKPDSHLPAARPFAKPIIIYSLLSRYRS